MENNRNDFENGQKESASERFRRLLSESAKKQPVEPLGKFNEESQGIDSAGNLEDTSPIKISNDELTSQTPIDYPTTNSSASIKPQNKFSALLKRQYKIISNDIQNLYRRLREKRKSVKNSNRSLLGAGKSHNKTGDGSNRRSCLLYGILGSFGAVILIGMLAVSFLIFQYFRIASGLPSVDDLQQYASQFETTRIYDRNGNLIYEILDPNAGRRTYVKLEDISPYVIAATIATEDKDFYTNPGFDPWGIMRALWQN